jgi:outer membrane lipoprotein-sorting protein
MRWDYFSKAKPDQLDRAFLSDGNVLWAVFVDGQTYYKKALKDDLLPVAITFLSGKGDLKADFHAKLDASGTRGAPGDQVLELTPKKPTAYKTLWLVVDPKDHRVKRSIILNANNELSTFEFFEPDTAKALTDQTFVFDEKGNAKKGFRRIEPPK